MMSDKEVRDQEALAVVVGEAWAQRMVDKQRSEGITIGGEWPGRPEDVAILAKPLSDNPDERQLLGQIILTNARRAWDDIHATLVERNRRPPPEE